MSNARNLVDGIIPSSITIKHSVANNITATGTTQAGAATLIGVDVAVVTFGSGGGVILNASSTGGEFIVINMCGGTINVYPPVGGAIDTLAVNTPFALPNGGKIMFIATSTSQYYTLNATYS